MDAGTDRESVSLLGSGCTGDVLRDTGKAPALVRDMLQCWALPAGEEVETMFDVGPGWMLDPLN